MSSSSRRIDRVCVTFDEPTLVADAGLLVPATLMARLGLESLVNQMVRLGGRVGGARPGRKVATLVAAILAGATHIDHADRLRAGSTGRVLPFRVMAPSTLGTFLRSFTFGHVRQLDRVVAETIRRAWSFGAGPGEVAMTIDLDSTIVEVHGKQKHGGAFGYTRVLGYHPLLATRAGTGEVLHARLRKGSSQRGTKRFCEELVARLRRCGATGPLTLRADAGFFSWDLLAVLDRLGVTWSVTVQQNPCRGRSPPSTRTSGSTSPIPTGARGRWPKRSMSPVAGRRSEPNDGFASSSAAPGSPTPSNSSSGRTGDTMPSSRTSGWTRSRPTASTGPTPPSSWPSGI